MLIAICDDDKRERDRIEQYITDFRSNVPSFSFDIATFCSGEELICAYNEGACFDFLFLDIQMKDIDGIQAAQEIRKVNKYAIIFFISGFTQYVSAAFALNAFQFLIKPVKKEAFDREFRRALKKHLLTHKKYIIDLNQRAIVLEIKDILYIESTDHSVIVHSERGQYTKHGKLSDEEKKLVSFGFVRTHQSFLVNMAYIAEITQTDVILSNGIKVMVSRRKRAEVMGCYNRYMTGFSIWTD